MVIDGVEAAVKETYDFKTTGIHKVRFYISNNGKFTSFYQLFYPCITLLSFRTSPYIDTSNVTNMNLMFQRCESLTSLKIGSSCNIDNVTDWYRFSINVPSGGIVYYPSGSEDLAAAWVEKINAKGSSGWTSEEY